jgi:hypothetical protein
VKNCRATKSPELSSGWRPGSGRTAGTLNKFKTLVRLAFLLAGRKTDDDDAIGDLVEYLRAGATENPKIFEALSAKRLPLRKN